MNKIVKNAFILTAITVIAGLLLGVVYGVTKEPIANAKANSKQEAFQSVLSDADSAMLSRKLPLEKIKAVRPLDMSSM